MVQETKNYENGAHNDQSAMKKKLLPMGYLIGLISKKARKLVLDFSLEVYFFNLNCWDSNSDWL